MIELTSPHTITGRNHPYTSFSAADLARISSGGRRRQVLEVLAYHGDLTDEEIQDKISIPANTERPRRVELVDMGFVAATPYRRSTHAGVLSIVWGVTERGMLALEAAEEINGAAA